MCRQKKDFLEARRMPKEGHTLRKQSSLKIENCNLLFFMHILSFNYISVWVNNNYIEIYSSNINFSIGTLG